MTSEDEAIVLVAQTMLRMRHPKGAIGRDEIAAVVHAAIVRGWAGAASWPRE
jgi:hypothetical protein